MPSPFPGMDPYLEDPAYWQDFHQRFITYWCDALADLLPDHYEARIEEQVRLEERVPRKPRQIKRVRSDVALLQRGVGAARSAGPSGALVLEPVTLPLVILDEVRESRIKILQRRDRTLVTVLELLSPSNKSGPGRGEYLAKRNALLREIVHLVEVDLLVRGHRLPTGLPLPAGDYYALVARGDQRPNCDVYGWTIRWPLPAIPIPLKAPDPDIQLNLGSVFATTYERGRYARSLNYAAPPRLPLAEADLRWAAEQAQAAHH